MQLYGNCYINLYVDTFYNVFIRMSGFKCIVYLHKIWLPNALHKLIFIILIGLGQRFPRSFPLPQDNSLISLIAMK